VTGAERLQDGVVIVPDPVGIRSHDRRAEQQAIRGRFTLLKRRAAVGRGSGNRHLVEHLVGDQRGHPG
jgi:hypothetical protein